MYHAWGALALTLMCFISLGCALLGYKESNEGLCTTTNKVSRTRTKWDRKYITFQYSKKCFLFSRKICYKNKADWRDVSRVEVYTGLESETVCCSGYSAVNNVCTPVCQTACVQGECTRPDTCTCLTGYVKSASQDHVCEPTCSPACAHGVCSGPNTCTCHDGYEQDALSYECKPSCKQPCVNGKCTLPEDCSCNGGYEKHTNDSYTCSPVCSRECEHGKCTLPEICECDTGYEPDPLDSYKCVPVCSEVCTNGVCTAPEKCSCNEGYQTDPSNSYSCEPVCKETCRHGECSAPETCTCFDGYEKDGLDQYECKPICKDYCINADCSAPDECSCHEGFVKKNDSHKCEPFCSKDCLNGQCTYPDVCSCYSGYLKNATDLHKCEPVCTKGCVNAECATPEHCKCWAGYQPDAFNKYKCEPICSKECKNGKCILPEVCECNSGYISNQLDPYICDPHCMHGCFNAKCTEPDHCECLSGYGKDDNSSTLCNPICSVGCRHADCIRPETCECWEGYEVYDSNTTCVPTCSLCQYGICAAPETCACWRGYENPAENNSTCEPVCDGGCTNSKCTAPNQCSCEEGFVNSTGQLNACSPFCSKKCINSICIDPDYCECLSGFEKSNIEENLCLPVCSEECFYGVCTNPEVCTCLWGFENLPNSSNCSNTESSALRCSLKGEISFPQDADEHSSSQMNVSVLSNLEECLFFGRLFSTSTFSLSQEEIVMSLNCTSKYSNVAGNVDLIECEIEAVTSGQAISDQTSPFLEQPMTSSFFADHEPSSTLTPSQYDESKSMSMKLKPKSFVITQTEEKVLDLTTPNYGLQANVSKAQNDNNYYKTGSTEASVPSFTDHEYHKKPKFMIFRADDPNRLELSQSEEETVSGQTSHDTSPGYDSNEEIDSSTISIAHVSYRSELSSSRNKNENNAKLRSTILTTPFLSDGKGHKKKCEIIIQILSYLQKKQITKHYFEPLQHQDIPKSWCQCSSKTNGDVTVGSFKIQLYLCPCGIERSEPSVSALLSWLPKFLWAVLVLVVMVAVCYGSFRLWRSTKSKDYWVSKNETDKNLPSVEFSSKTVVDNILLSESEEDDGV